MEIRQAILNDLEAIHRIELENFDSDEAISREHLQEHIEQIKTSFLVAEDQGQILGYLEGPVVKERHLKDSSFTQVEDWSHEEGGYVSITSLSIAKEAQSLGVGKKLIEAMKELVISDHRQGINLTCHDYLIGYYEKHGFVNEGLSQSTYSGGVWYDLVWDNPELTSSGLETLSNENNGKVHN